MTFAILYPVVFISMVFVWRRINKKRALEAEGAIRLPPDEENASGSGPRGSGLDNPDLAEEEAEIARFRAGHQHPQRQNGNGGV